MRLYRDEIADCPDEQRRRADPDEEGAGRERFDRAKRGAADEPGQRIEMAECQNIVRRHVVSGFIGPLEAAPRSTARTAPMY